MTAAGHKTAPNLRRRAEDVHEWRPGRSSAVSWTVLGAGVMVLGLGLFAVPSILRAGPAGGTFQIGLVDVLLVAALTVLLVIAHEAIHGVAMLAFGARPLVLVRGPAS